jgi:hypothetical protein
LSRDRASIAERDFEDTAGGSEKSRPKNTIDIFPQACFLQEISNGAWPWMADNLTTSTGEPHPTQGLSILSAWDRWRSGVNFSIFITLPEEKIRRRYAQIAAAAQLKLTRTRIGHPRAVLYGDMKKLKTGASRNSSSDVRRSLLLAFATCQISILLSNHVLLSKTSLL